MYLQSLEIVGFKSFAQKTTLDFHRGVTAIVGPNGCGKSNVLDAIRWVLGEQSAKALRGDEMADVIFNGTDHQQAVGMAEVSATFAECEKDLGTEYNEVRITRRVYRDGRSDYLLNNVICRLKDVQMLFMDTGIGRTAYSIMEQGKLDLILSSRPEDRRTIFEEAAGITKYKTQKKEALRKLEYTDANLLRLADIAKEVKRQIGSLQRQAGKARRYRTLFEDLRTLDVHLSGRTGNEIAESIRRANEEIARFRSLHHSLEEQIESHEYGLGTQRQGLDLLEEKILATRQTGNDLRSQIGSTLAKIGFNEERIRESAELAERYENDIAAAGEKARAEGSRLEEIGRQFDQITQTLQAEERQLQKRQREANELRQQRVDQDRSAQENQRQIQTGEGRLAALRGDLASLINQREADETRLGLLRQEVDQATAAHQHFSVLGAEAHARLEEAHVTIQKLREGVKDREHELAELQRRLQQAESEYTSNRRILAETESKVDVLRQLNEQGAGLGAGTQAVLKGLDNPELYRSAVVGVLANLLEVPGDMIPAIEAALGQHLQAIFFSDPAVAREISGTLATGKVGRAAIVPDSEPHRAGFGETSPRVLEASAGRVPEAERSVALPEQAIGWALDLVGVRPEAASLVRRLLGNVVLAPDLQSAFQVRLVAPDLAIATLGGEFISELGVVFAGHAAENDHSILQRKLQIRQLEQQLQHFHEVQSRTEQSRVVLSGEVERVQSEVWESRDAAQRAQAEALTLQGEISLLDRELRENEGKLKSLGGETKKTQQRLEATAEQIGLAEGKLEAGTRQLDDLEQRLTALIAQADALKTREDTLAEILSDSKIRVATEWQRRENLEQQRQPMTAHLAELQDLIATRQRDIANYRSRSERFATETETLRESIERLRFEQSRVEAAVASLLAERATQVEAVDSVEQNLRQLRKQLTDCQEARGEEEVKATQWRLRLDNLRDHVSRRYQIDLETFTADWYKFQVALRDQRKRLIPNDAPDPAPPPPETGGEIDWEFVQTAVAELTERLDAMGPVNLEAIQEYDELEERQKFLEEQNADLVKSKTELLNVINKINATTKELFADTFEQVRKNFQLIFVELFGGGSANLLLVDDADPLESGIEIIAKPPGKQLQSISLLSGGERAMAAVALLFAVYMVKPSPFCVLDEMDAPLDESNINRFLRILDRFVTQSQFVVITHNKRTIAKADTLYGVTMEEHGVSKLVGVRLTRREQSTQAADLIGTSKVAPSIAESFGKQ